jgi:hypothetical protein
LEQAEQHHQQQCDDHPEGKVATEIAHHVIQFLTGV